MKTSDGRRLPPEAQEELRRRVVRAVVHDGVPQTEAARLFGVGRTSIHRWVKGYRRGGRKALAARKRGPKPRSRLAGHQAATVVRLITDRCPDQLKLPFALWTREAVAMLIARRFGVFLSVWTVGRYLKRWGFTPQKPMRRAYERNPAAVRRWLDEEYPAIRAQARREGATIYWGDQMGMRSDHAAGRSYGRKGRTPVTRGTGKRFGGNMMSALTNRGKLSFMVFRRRFTAEVCLQFLGRLQRQSRRKVIMIWDGHPVHRSKRVRRWLAKPSTRVKIFFLPPYSPELNPDEYLNHDVKANAVGKRRPKDAEEMMGNVRRYLRTTQRMPDLVRRFFHHPCVRYASLRNVP
jgi:transposase